MDFFFTGTSTRTSFDHAHLVRSSLGLFLQKKAGSHQTIQQDEKGRGDSGLIRKSRIVRDVGKVDNLSRIDGTNITQDLEWVKICSQAPEVHATKKVPTAHPLVHTLRRTCITCNRVQR